MKKRTWKIVVAVCIAIAGLALLNAAGAQVRPHGPSQAPGPHRPARPAVPPGNWHGGGMGWWGWGLGFGLGWEASPFVFPYYYPYTGIYEPFDIEGTEEAAPGAAAPNMPAPAWYYCESAKAYYPQVTQCPEGWRMVPATPPPPPARAP